MSQELLASQWQKGAQHAGECRKRLGTQSALRLDVVGPGGRLRRLCEEAED